MCILLDMPTFAYLSNADPNNEYFWNLVAHFDSEHRMYREYHPHNDRFTSHIEHDVTPRESISIVRNRCRAYRIVVFNGRRIVLICGRPLSHFSPCRCDDEICNRPESVIGPVGRYDLFPFGGVAPDGNEYPPSSFGITTVDPEYVYDRMRRRFVYLQPFYEELNRVRAIEYTLYLIESRLARNAQL